ncbi:MAG: hypothetical protein QM680_04680 [Luteolibacter sp.]
MRISLNLLKINQFYNQYTIAFHTAAITPMPPANTAKILRNPPRTLGASASTTPIKPNTIATTASNNPPMAPTLKLKIAAMIAIKDEMLKDAFLPVDVFITLHP